MRVILPFAVPYFVHVFPEETFKGRGEGKMSEEDMWNVLHDLASLSAHSLPICPTYALIQEIVRL